jgi:hypothetical protein
MNAVELADESDSLAAPIYDLLSAADTGKSESSLFMRLVPRGAHLGPGSRGPVSRVGRYGGTPNEATVRMPGRARQLAKVSSRDRVLRKPIPDGG